MRVLCVESSPETPLRGCCRGPGTMLSNSRPIPGLSRQRCVLETGSRSFFYILSFFFSQRNYLLTVVIMIINLKKKLRFP